MPLKTLHSPMQSKGSPTGSGWLGCIFPCLGRSQIMVSFVAQLATSLAILSQHQASKCVSSNCTFCLAPSWSASLVGGSSLEDDDSLESFWGLSSLGLFGCCFCQMDWTFSPASDSWSVSSCLLSVSWV